MFGNFMISCFLGNPTSSCVQWWRGDRLQGQFNSQLGIQDFSFGAVQFRGLSKLPDNLRIRNDRPNIIHCTFWMNLTHGHWTCSYQVWSPLEEEEAWMWACPQDMVRNGVFRYFRKYKAKNHVCTRVMDYLSLLTTYFIFLSISCIICIIRMVGNRCLCLCMFP